MEHLNNKNECWCRQRREYLITPEETGERIRMLQRRGYKAIPDRLVKDKEEISRIRESGRVNIAVLDYVAANIKEGITTEEINRWVYDQTLACGAVPAPLHYDGFPKSVCTSVNEQVCHGIPSEKVVLKDGDIINVDVSTNLGGYYSDSSRMFCIGEVSGEKQSLVDIARKCVEKGLEQVRPGALMGDMGWAVYRCAHANGYSIVREIGGHGIGLAFHEDPWVGYVTRPKTGLIMRPGFIFTIEPMVNMGSDEIYTDEEDDWTVRTEDGLPSAQWEVTVLVTETGCEVICW